VLLLLSLNVGPVAHAQRIGQVSGLAAATGLAINTGTRELYVKGGTSGTVWRVPIGNDGSLGQADTVSSDLGSAVHIALDLAGNLYGAQPGGRPFSLYLRRLAPMSTTAQQTDLRLGGFSSAAAKLTGAFAIENPGGITNKLFFSIDDSPAIYSFTLGDFNSGRETNSPLVGNSCGAIRSVAYRQRLGDLIASIADNVVVRISASDGVCTSIPGAVDFIHPEGVAWDNSGQRIFVADSGTGGLYVINPDGSKAIVAGDLASPSDVAYDSGFVFVAEPAASRVSVFSANVAAPPTLTPSIGPPPPTVPVTVTPTLARTATPTVSLSQPGPGDANCDGTVTAADLPAVLKSLYANNVSCGADANGDGVVDATDIPPTLELVFEP
jgi:DNA-binding beta-propeller fold protein YncE